MFKKYQSIKKGYDTKYVAFLMQQDELKDRIWEATEKIHGCNFSAIVDRDGNITYASRSKVVTDSEPLFNYRGHVHLVEDKVKALAKEIFDGLKEANVVQVFFEYYGGDIMQSPRIPYFQDDAKKDFIVLDIYVDRQAIDQEMVRSLATEYGLKHVPVLGSGTLEEMLKFNPNDMKSVVAAEDGVDTYMEGIVLKPVIDYVAPDGERAMIKIIADKFSEDKLDSFTKAKVSAKKEESAEFYRDKEAIEKKCTVTRVQKASGNLGGSATFRELQMYVAEDIIKELAEEVDFQVNPKLAQQLVVPVIKEFFNHGKIPKEN